MYQVTQAKDLFENYVLTDTDSGVTATITPQRGGMLTSLVKNGHEYIFINPENYPSTERPRCAVPVLFPYSGRIQDEVLHIRGGQYPASIHGIAQNMNWKVLGTDTTDGASITIGITSDEETKKTYPYEFSLEITYTLKGDTVTIAPVCKNCDTEDMPFDLGFHPYFTSSGLDNLTFSVQGEIQFDPSCSEKVPFDGQLKMSAVTAMGSIVMNAQSPASFADGDYGVTVAFGAPYRNVVVWSGMPDRFICVEPWTGVPNALNEGTQGCILAPGETMQAPWTIQIR